MGHQKKVKGNCNDFKFNSPQSFNQHQDRTSLNSLTKSNIQSIKNILASTTTHHSLSKKYSVSQTFSQPRSLYNK